MWDDDATYYQSRAEQELELAQSATNPHAARAHYLIAGFYLDRVYNRPSPPARPVAQYWSAAPHDQAKVRPHAA
jgi:hypothetical protein